LKFGEYNYNIAYYDARSVNVAIAEFLCAAQQQLAPEFREVQTTSVENLLYVKEDFIMLI